jgi:thiamine transport system permease protein
VVQADAVVVHVNSDMNLRWRATIAIALWALTFLFFGWPVARVLAVSTRATAISEVFADPRIRSIAWFSLWQATVSTVMSALIAVGLAGVLSRYAFAGRRIVLGVLSAPFTLPTVVVGTAFLIASPKSFHQSAGLIIAAHVFYNVGFISRSVLGALDALNPDLRDSAHVLGANPFRAFLTVDLPLVFSSLRRVCGVVFGLCFAAYGTVLILGGPRRSTLDVEIARQALQFGRLDRASTVAVIQFLVVVAAITFSRRETKLHRDSNVISRPRQQLRPNRPTDRLAVATAALVICALTFTPLFSVAKRAFRDPNGNFGFANLRQLNRTTRGSGLSETPLHSVLVSLQSALFVCVLTCVVSTLIATLATFRNPQTSVPRFARWLATSLGVAPLAVSSVTLGLGVLIGFAKSPIAWRSSPWMVPVVQTIICLPFSIATFLAAARALPEGPLEAAATLGAKPLLVWRTVWLPLLRRPARIAAGTAFAVALGEFGAASLLVLPSRETMPVVIARLAQRPGAVLNGQAAALTVILATITALVTAISLASRSERDPSSVET